MRCRRCHTKLDPSKKMCPVCGTLVRKKRGKIKLAPQAGAGNVVPVTTNNIFTKLSALFESKTLVAAIALIVIAGAIVAMISTGVFDSCKGCSSCGKKDDTYDPVTAPKSLNSTNVSQEYYRDGVLYYVSGDSIKALSDDGMESIIAAGAGINCVYADSKNVYYIKDGDLWASPLEKPLTISDDPEAKYASSRLIAATLPDSDAGVSKVLGYALEGDMICYWGSAAGGNAICAYDPASGEKRTLFTGPCGNMQCCGGRVYYVSSAPADNGVLYSISLKSGDVRTVYNEDPVVYYAFCSGRLMVYTEGDDSGILSQIDLASGELIVRNSTEPKRWDGMTANDEYLFYYSNGVDGGDIYRRAIDDAEGVRIFSHNGKIKLGGIAGDYFSVWTGLSDGPDIYAGASRTILNIETREMIGS